jgi:hypothetical protein
MVNDPQDDLLDLIRQEFEKANKEKRSAIHTELEQVADNACLEMYKVFVYVSGHDLWSIGLNKDHDRDGCDKCQIITED